MIDIGANLADAAFAGDLEAVLRRARAAGIERILVTGTSLEQSRRALELARTHAGLLVATAGVHPHVASAWDGATLDALRRLLREPEVVAVGETGFDLFRELSPRDAQLRACEAQLELAAECGKPVFLHDRQGFAALRPLLARWRPRLRGGVVHCFTGTRDELHAYLALDLHIGITGWLCDERRGTALAALVHEIPGDRLLIETDAPYLLPRTLRDRPKTRRNEPQWLGEVCAVLARCRGESAAELARRTRDNAVALFGLGADPARGGAHRDALNPPA